MKRKAMVLAATVLVAGAAVAAAMLALRGKDDASLATAVRKDVRLTVEATGRLQAAVAFELGPPSVEGFWDYNLAWLAPEGSRVKEGDVVARFDSTEIDERLREAQAKLETTTEEREKEERSLNLKIEQLKLDLVKAEGSLKELDIQLDVPEGLLSSIEIEQKRLQRDLAQKRAQFLKEKIAFERKLVATKLELLDVKRKDAEDKIAYNQASKDKFAVKAPISGIVMAVPKMRGGDRWEVGESVWMMAKVLRVADSSTLRVEADLLEADAARVAVGAPAEITVDALPGVVIRTKVAELGGVIREKSPQDPTKVVDAVLPIEGLDTEQLRPGMGVHVVLETKSLPGQIVVPVDAVVATREGTFIDVADEHGVIARRPVKLGDRCKDGVVVLEGVAEGDKVRRSGGGAA